MADIIPLIFSEETRISDAVSSWEIATHSASRHSASRRIQSTTRRTPISSTSLWPIIRTWAAPKKSRSASFFLAFRAASKRVCPVAEIILLLMAASLLVPGRSTSS